MNNIKIENNFKQFDNETLAITNLIYDRTEKSFILKNEHSNLPDYLLKYTIINDNEIRIIKNPLYCSSNPKISIKTDVSHSIIETAFTQIITDPVYIIDALDECYSHALIDRIFPYFWSVSKIDGYKQNKIIIFIKEDRLLLLGKRRRVIDNKEKEYKGVWNNLINLLNPKQVIFEHLLPINEKILFKNAYLYAENNKLCRWQRTFWNNNIYYPGRPVDKILYNDNVIKLELDNFISMVKSKYNIIDKINDLKNIIIIERLNDRLFDKNLLIKFDTYFKNLDSSFVCYNGITNLENMTFYEQIKLFNTNDIIVFRHGSCLTNILWVKKDTIIIELDIQQNRPKVIKRICDFTNSIQMRYNYNETVNNSNILFENLDQLLKIN